MTVPPPCCERRQDQLYVSLSPGSTDLDPNHNAPWPAGATTRVAINCLDGSCKVPDPALDSYPRDCDWILTFPRLDTAANVILEVIADVEESHRLALPFPGCRQCGALRALAKVRMIGDVSRPQAEYFARKCDP
jgi:hypothetical protein